VIKAKPEICDDSRTKLGATAVTVTVILKILNWKSGAIRIRRDYQSEHSPQMFGNRKNSNFPNLDSDGCSWIEIEPTRVVMAECGP
jgi:hypothetical protein